MEITKIKIGSNVYDVKDASAISASDVASAINMELYGSTTKPSGASVVTSQNIATAVQNAGITTGGVSTYAQLEYAVSRINGSGALTIAGTDPVYVVNVTANISSVALQNNPIYGHSCHVIFKSADSSSYTVAIANDSTNRICPSSDGVILTVPASGSGYVEVDFLNTGNSNIGDEVYVRGI